MVWLLTDLTLVTGFALLLKVTSAETIHTKTVIPQDCDLVIMRQ